MACETQKERHDESRVFLFGDPSGIRTPDPLLKRQLLCRLSYRIMRNMGKMNWQGRLDSNQRMRESKSLALPLGYTPVWKSRRGIGIFSQSLIFLWGG